MQHIFESNLRKKHLLQGAQLFCQKDGKKEYY